jgi:hypothetical protein
MALKGSLITHSVSIFGRQFLRGLDIVVDGGYPAQFSGEGFELRGRRSRRVTGVFADVPRAAH